MAVFLYAEGYLAVIKQPYTFRRKKGIIEEISNMLLNYILVIDKTF